MEEGFKRLNFFDGLFTRAEDWCAEQSYQLEKRRMHTMFLHTPGIVFGCLDNLGVKASEDGNALYVEPGYAIDADGNDIFLPKTLKLTINLQGYTLPGTVYVSIRYGEEPTDKRENVANPGQSDAAFIREYSVVEVKSEQPDNRKVIELARIKLSEDAMRVRNPADPHNPADNEVDETKKPVAGAVKGRVRLRDLAKIVREGEISVVASTDPAPSENDTNVLIERVTEQEPHRFYHVSAFPTQEARLLWRMETLYNKGIEYRLYFKNLSGQTARVLYRVYRLHE